MANDLDGTRVALLIAPAGTEEPEFTEPRKALEAAGATVTVVGLDTDDAHAVNHDLEPAGTSVTVPRSRAGMIRPITEATAMTPPAMPSSKGTIAWARSPSSITGIAPTPVATAVPLARRISSTNSEVRVGP